MAKPLVINTDLEPSETNPHSWLVLTGSKPNAAGPRIMAGTLRPSYRGFAVPGAAAFARAKINVVPSPDSPWAITAARAEVLLPAGADDRFSCPRTLMEDADRLATQPTDPLLAYVTVTWMPGRLHEMYEEIRAFALEEIVSLDCPVLLVLHAPHLKLSSALPHCHLCIVAVPDLRIVDDALVEAVVAETFRRALPVGVTSAVGARRQRHILSGLIKCGVCGANYVVGSKDYYRCASVKERGTCGNSTTIRISRVEELALSTLQSELLTDEHAKLFATEFNREVDRLRRDESSRDGEAKQRLALLEVEVENLAANMLAGVVSPTIVRMLDEREAECAALRRRIARPGQSEPVLLPHPALRARFEARVADLRRSLSDPANRAEIARVVGELIEEIVVYPPSADTPAEAEVTARLSNLISFANAKSRPPEGGRLSSQSAIKVVAGTRFDLCRIRRPYLPATRLGTR